MGRSYWFECPKCGYRTKVSGRADRGLSFCVQTILCRDCKELYDAVTRLKVQDESGGWGQLGGLYNAASAKAPAALAAPPAFSAVLNRLPLKGAKRFNLKPAVEVPTDARCGGSAFELFNKSRHWETCRNRSAFTWWVSNSNCGAVATDPSELVGIAEVMTGRAFLDHSSNCGI